MANHSIWLYFPHIILLLNPVLPGSNLEQRLNLTCVSSAFKCICFVACLVFEGIGHYQRSSVRERMNEHPIIWWYPSVRKDIIDRPHCGPRCLNWEVLRISGRLRLCCGFFKPLLSRSLFLSFFLSISPRPSFENASSATRPLQEMRGPQLINLQERVQKSDQARVGTV